MIQIIVGLILSLFLPGYLVVRILFAEFKTLEKLLFSIAFSIMISVFIAIFLGYDANQAAWTGGLNTNTAYVAEAIVNGVLLIILIVKEVLANIYKK